MAQESVWEREYRDPKLVTKDAKPQKAVLRYLKELKKKDGLDFSQIHVLDLGCGTGRNSNYLASRGATVTGIEISHTALELARERAKQEKLAVSYVKQSMGEPFPLEDNSIDLILDITSSNSLNESERSIYLEECARVLKPGGHFFVRTLAKEGDKNARELIKRSPGPEKDTYVNSTLGLTERVFTKEDFMQLYSPHFQMQSAVKTTSYTRFEGQSYKRNFWLFAMIRK